MEYDTYKGYAESCDKEQETIQKRIDYYKECQERRNWDIIQYKTELESFSENYNSVKKEIDLLYKCRNCDTIMTDRESTKIVNLETLDNFEIFIIENGDSNSDFHNFVFTSDLDRITEIYCEADNDLKKKKYILLRCTNIARRGL